ncbi:inorganic pyrophosphatase [Tsukamurella strandjordii]|uniref:Inorganic pyrophosphatase n=1 Tax=Tsukamurella strandjordii TaxID=147577 RepID=A0AA90SHP3_9ACTN|nr:inorganic pyrophosphatase [Tsukamurella strandjordii]MDP0399054.1 inorganic pyrophosphatase [Tsukamurella strandjordii]
MADTDFFAALDGLLASSAVVIDRPRGTGHPRYPAIVYPVDYGYLDGTVSGDGQGIDLFRGTAAGRGVVGAFVIVDPGKRDTEIKLLVDCSATEIDAVDGLLGRLSLPRAYLAR